MAAVRHCPHCWGDCPGDCQWGDPDLCIHGRTHRLPWRDRARYLNWWLRQRQRRRLR